MATDIAPPALDDAASPASPFRSLPGRLRAFWEPRRRQALALILLLAAFTNFYELQRNGYANLYYAAAIRSMLESWHNFFFVSFDPGGFVTVDKPPLGFWIQAASAKLFGFSGFSILLPEALAGVLSVGVLYHLVRRVFGAVRRAAGGAVPGHHADQRRHQPQQHHRQPARADRAAGRLGREPRRRARAACAGCCSARCWSASASTSRCSRPIWSCRPSRCLSARRAAALAHAPLAPGASPARLMLAVSLAWVVAVDLTPATPAPLRRLQRHQLRA